MSEPVLTSATIQVTNFGDSMRAAFDLLRTRHNLPEAQWEQREQAYALFEEMGLPGVKHEEWKYTNLKALSGHNWSTMQPDPAAVQTLLDQSIVRSLAAHRLVFVNGVFYPDLSEILRDDRSLVITGFTQATPEQASLIEQHLGKYAPAENEALNALNMALHTDGALIHVPAGKKPDFPVILIHITDSSNGPAMAHPRNLILVDEGASLVCIETYYAIGAHPGFCNAVNEIYVGKSGAVEHYKLQRETGETTHNNFTRFFQETDTRINQVTLTLDGKLLRNNLHFYMNGPGCNSLLYGLYLPRQNQHVDNHTRVDHAQPNCFSDEKYKGILKDRSTAVFNGKIVVHPDAQKTNAYQRNQNILLSNEAVVNTKPQLEIFADDVKCTHGATIGQLDEEPLFYMRSRGIPEDVARKLLLNAFAADIAEKIKIPELVDLLESQIEANI